MLARPVRQLPEGLDWTYEIKLDGYRTLAMKRRAELTLFSRRGNNLNLRFPAIADSFAFMPDNTIVDGEIVALDNTGRPSFSSLQNSRSRDVKLYYYAFDVLAFRGRDVRSLPLTDRRELLITRIVKDTVDAVRISEVFDASAKRIVAAARQQQLEGIVAKRAESIYEAGQRSGAWVKYKTNKGQELVIGGYQPGPNVFESLLVGYYLGKSLMFVAKIKNGFSPPLRRQIAKQFKGLDTRVCPFANLPEPRNARRGEALTAEVMQRMHWLRPKLVAQIEFTEWTKANHLRHSRFVGMRDDKRPSDVVREMYD
jgi:DNA ligase D-like protein (predicted ligase)